MDLEVQANPGMFITALLFYFGLLAAIGYYSYKKTDSLKEFFVMGGTAGAIMAGLSYFATQYSMSTFMGVPGTVYKIGYSGLSISVPGAVFSMLLPALLVGRRMLRLGHKNGFLTLPDYLADRYESSSLRGISALLIIVYLVPYIGAQTIGAGVIFNVFTGAPEWVGVAIMVVLVTIYCFTGGVRAAMMTDVLQGIMMILTAVITFVVSIKMTGGFSGLHETLLAEHSEALSMPGMNGHTTIPMYISMILMWSLFAIGQPQLTTKFFSMKNQRALVGAILAGGIGMWISATLIEWSGVSGIAIFGNSLDRIDFVVPLILTNALNPFIASFLMAGIVAAAMSTIDHVLIMTTGAVTRDIYQNIINPEATDQEVFKLSKIVTIIIGLCALAIGIWRPSSIFKIILFTFSGLGVQTVLVILGIYWKKANKYGAITGVVIGQIVLISMTFWFNEWTLGFNPLLPTSLVTLIVMVIVSISTRPPSEKVIERHFN